MGLEYLKKTRSITPLPGRPGGRIPGWRSGDIPKKHDNPQQCTVPAESDGIRKKVTERSVMAEREKLFL